ncbi:MAG: TPM domain-containing protein [bacterium]
MIRSTRVILWPVLLLAAVACTVLPASGRADEFPPPPPRHFHDAVGLVGDAAARKFADDLYGFEQRTGIQFVVAVLLRHSGSLEDHVNRLYEHWGIGQRETQRGVLFVVFLEQKESRIEVGYGLEASLPDVAAGRILRNMVKIPASPADRRFSYVIGQVAAAVAPGDPLAGGGEPGGARPATNRNTRALIICLVIFLILVIVIGTIIARFLGPLVVISGKRKDDGLIGWGILGGGGSWGGGSSGGGGWFGGGGGGGFSGGGGSSGGGGASGGW